jgi:hypothetical protein
MKKATPMAVKSNWPMEPLCSTLARYLNSVTAAAMLASKLFAVLAVGQSKVRVTESAIASLPVLVAINPLVSLAMKQLSLLK